eukprot:SAG31_NODE_5178_length_2697_cov_3.029638_5_plen_37_part_00
MLWTLLRDSDGGWARNLRMAQAVELKIGVGGRVIAN